MTTHKPSAPQAMQCLIRDIRAAMPFDQPAALLCRNTCAGCPKKLMEFLAAEVSGWESALASGSQPTLGDIERLANTSRKIYRVLEKNHLLNNGEKSQRRTAD